MARTIFFTIFFAIALQKSALAWNAEVNGPDVFGKITVVASEHILNKSLVVQCDTETELFLAFIIKKKEFDTTPEVPAKLLIKTSDAAPTILDATLRDWNDNYMGVVVAGRNDDVIKVIHYGHYGDSAFN